MSRQPWTETEVADLKTLSWAAFSAKHPSRSYDSWEVKRRRVVGGSAGTRRRPAVDQEQLRDAAQAVLTLAEFVSELADAGS